MKRQRIFLALLVTMMLTAACSQADLAAEGKPPDFTLTDVRGQKFSLKAYEKKTVLLIFGTTWCPSCRAEIPHFKEIYAAYSPQGLQVAYIDIQEPREKVARFSAKYQLPYRTLLDVSGEVAGAYDVMGVPSMVLLRNGKVLTRDYRLVDAYLEKMFPRSAR